MLRFLLVVLAYLRVVIATFFLGITIAADVFLDVVKAIILAFLTESKKRDGTLE